MSEQHPNSGIKPSQEQTSQMASDMLNSAISQKDAIANSFQNQREELLKAVAQSKEQTLNQTGTPQQPSEPATQTGTTPGNDIPPPTPEELAILHQLLDQKPQENNPAQEVNGQQKSTENTGSIPPPTAEELKLLEQLIAKQSAPATPTPDQVMLQIAQAIKDMVASEVALQLSRKND